MLLPPYGVCLPVRYHRAVDGRTIEVGVATTAVDALWTPALATPENPRNGEALFTVELADCECPSLAEEGGRAVREAAALALEDARRLALVLPLPPDQAALVRSFGTHPLPGHLFLTTDETLTQHLARRGLATQTAGRYPWLTVRSV
jgi:hypothetical protein